MFHLAASILVAITIFNQTPTEPASADADTLFPVEKWEYKQSGRRDPFVPLLGLQLSGGKGSSHLSVENLTLVGVLWGDKGYYALVKDGQNKGYILKKGDKVASGSVVQINRQAIVFEIVHAGVKTKYELPLKEKERR
jgi:Tfp pilus assembly protein PilP